MNIGEEIREVTFEPIPEDAPPVIEEAPVTVPQREKETVDA